MWRMLSGLGVPLAVFACGAAERVGKDAGDTADHGDQDATSSEFPSIVGSDATPAPAMCAPCTANSDCGEGGDACVALDGGGGYCAPGCNKEGYCTPDRACARVADPTGQAWAACVPIGGCAAAP